MRLPDWKMEPYSLSISSMVVVAAERLRLPLSAAVVERPSKSIVAIVMGLVAMGIVAIAMEAVSGGILRDTS